MTFKFNFETLRKDQATSQILEVPKLELHVELNQPLYEAGFYSHSFLSVFQSNL